MAAGDAGVGGVVDAEGAEVEAAADPAQAQCSPIRRTM